MLNTSHKEGSTLPHKYVVIIVYGKSVTPIPIQCKNTRQPSNYGGIKTKSPMVRTLKQIRPFINESLILEAQNNFPVAPHRHLIDAGAINESSDNKRNYYTTVLDYVQ